MKALIVVGIVLAFVVGAGAASLIPVGLWFCVDDHLAELFDYPPLGAIPWWLIWVVWMLLTGLFGGTRAVVKKEVSQ